MINKQDQASKAKAAIIPDMKKLARLFLLCMLMLTIPLQGALAASGYCGDEHQDTRVSQSNMHRLQEQHQSSHQHSKDGVTVKSGFAHCPSFGECCTGAIILGKPVSFLISRPSSEKIDQISSAYIGHIGECP